MMLDSKIVCGKVIRESSIKGSKCLVHKLVLSEDEQLRIQLNKHLKDTLLMQSGCSFGEKLQVYELFKKEIGYSREIAYWYKNLTTELEPPAQTE